MSPVIAVAVDRSEQAAVRSEQAAARTDCGADLVPRRACEAD